MALLNALYEAGETNISVAHPCDAIGKLVTINLDQRGEASVRLQGALTYQDRREELPAKYGESAYEDLPDAESYVRAVVASGLGSIANEEAVDEFFRRHGYPDLEAGHKPVMLGVDTNIMAWRIPEVLGFDSHSDRDANGRRPTTGYALATGVKEELDWHFKQYHTRELVEAFGREFERLENQPAGSNREGLLGLYEFRRLRTSRNVDFVSCDVGDESIVEGFRKYADRDRKRPLLLSNDYGFIDRAHERGLQAQHIEFPVDLPRSVEGTWTHAVDLLYYLTILFGVLVLPKATLYGVWDGKNGRHWQAEMIDVDCRSPKLPPKLERDLAILRATESH